MQTIDTTPLEAAKALARAIPRDLGQMSAITEYCHPSGTTHVIVFVSESEDSHSIFQGSSDPHDDVTSFAELRDRLREYIAEGKQAQDAALDAFWGSDEPEGLEEGLLVAMERTS